MSEPTTTPYSKRAEILADLWMNYRNDSEFSDFIEYNDIGLPLAYFVTEEIVASTPLAEKFINETFDLLIKSLALEDVGFEDLNEVFDVKAELDSEEE